MDEISGSGVRQNPNESLAATGAVDAGASRAPGGAVDHVKIATNDSNLAEQKVDHFEKSTKSATHLAVEGGFVDLYGRHDASRCLIICGWMSRKHVDAGGWSISASFRRGRLVAPSLIAFHDREDVRPHGVGFVVFLRTEPRNHGQLIQIELSNAQSTFKLSAAGGILDLPSQIISVHATAALAISIDQPAVAEMKALLSRQFVGEGFIDTYAYPASSSGLLISGWVSNVWIDQSNGPIEAIACFEGGSSDGEVTLNFFDRPDVHGIGLGIVVLLSLVDIPRGRPLSLLLISAGAVLSMRPAEQMCHVPTEQITATFLATITNSDLTPARDQLNKLLFQASYPGRDTIADLPDQVLIEVDDTILCGDDSIILIGWLLARRGTIKTIRLHAARHILDVDITTGLLWVERADVLESVGRTKGFADSHCGFIMRVPASCPIPKELYLEIETEAGDVGFKRIPSPTLDGIAAIKRILNDIDMKYADVDAIYDNIFGPAIKALNTERLRIPVQMHNVQFGQATRAPRYSIIIPLYRRIDFMEVQLALFATLGLGSDVEIIYVLDDPPRIRDAQRLADSLYQRFSVPFKLICLSQNVGFAPANNIGVRASSGEYICFMNSDVFPDTNDWLGRLAAHLDADPTLGVVGPTLLFEDGAVQHQGMFFREQPQFGGWAFPLHKRKGMRPSAETGLVWEAAITGACMLMRRDDVLRYGAFDEAYIIGDFEDTDLCLRLRTNGLGAAVDLAVQMHHLERKSQDTAASNWRSNLTLYNAWIHQRRWAEAIRWLEPAI